MYTSLTWDAMASDQLIGENLQDDDFHEKAFCNGDGVAEYVDGNDGFRG